LGVPHAVRRRGQYPDFVVPLIVDIRSYLGASFCAAAVQLPTISL
jgi:hypothetical protein